MTKISDSFNKNKKVKIPNQKQIEEGLYFDFEGFGNNEFRKKDSDTNILSFPASSELKRRSGELGDIAISVPYAKNEIQSFSN